MYENLLAQDAIRQELIRMLISGEIPPAMLFSGPPASGKLTAALETARVLSCTKTGHWNCACEDCRRHRNLVHTDLVLFGKRSFPVEIAAARDVLVEKPGKAAAYLFVRSVRKLLSRFNPVLWQGEEQKVDRASPIIQEIEEALDTIDPETITESALDEKTIKTIDDIRLACANLEPFVPETVSVTMVRNMDSWAHLAPSGQRKTVIIENADRMQDAARNAMLKTLEEPPESVRFILLTSRRASMIATVLSRSRIFSFSQRDTKATRMILERVFKTSSDATNLASFFESKMPFPPSEAIRFAELLAGLLLLDYAKTGLPVPEGYCSRITRQAAASSETMHDVLEELSEATKSFGSKDKAFANSFLQFMKSLLSVFSQMLAESGENPELMLLIERWSNHVREAAVQYGSLNRSPELLLTVLISTFGDRP